MKILILGASGMLGHQLWQDFSEKYKQVYATLQKNKKDYPGAPLFDDERVIENIDARNFSALEGVLKAINPEIVLNCIGITKRKERNNLLQMITLNALLPHVLVNWAATKNARIISFSTDCVFDGSLGNYTEASPCTATDFYGRTKSLGEIGEPFGFTLRSSFIGKELHGKTELLEWFMAQRSTVKGFTKAIYSGLTTLELSRVVDLLINCYPKANGVYHVSSDPISKFELLSLIRTHLNLDIDVLPDDHFRCDRSLDSNRFRRRFNYTPPSWQKMIKELSQFLKKEKK